MIKAIKQFIGFIFFVGPIALFWFIPWYWVVLYYNLYWTYTSYIIYEANKDKKELSLLYCLSLPLLFNFFGFLVVILTESKSKKVNEESSSNDSSDTLESNNSRLSEKEYYSSGNLRYEYFYNDDNQNGKFKEYHENGQLAKEGMIVNGSHGGQWKVYSKNGVLTSVLNMKDGKLHGNCIFYMDSGKILSEGYYENGKAKGIHIIYKSNGEISSQQDYSENEELVSKSEYSIVYLFDKDGNEYRYSINESDIPEEINDEDDVEINIALKYHNLLGRPIIPDDPEVEGDDENTYSFKYYTDGLELTDKQLESEEAEMIHKAFIISSLVKTDKKVKLEKTRRVLIHQIEDGLFLEDFGDGIYNETEVKGQRHILVREYQSTEEGKDDWSEYESETEDEFYLTGKDEGYRYDEGDLVKFFKIKNWEWTFNATNAEEDWSVEDDPDNILIGSLKIRNIKEKWNTYKNKFPKISSKSQFDISGMEKKKTDINFCPNCGVKITEKINFCGDCGQKLN